MTSIAAHHEEHSARQGPAPPPGGWRRLLYPGFVRAAWMVPLFFGIGSAIVVLCRWWGGWHPFWLGEIIVLVGALIAAPVGFLAGIGAFDYWVRYAIGAPTEPEDHSGHGAYSWRDYFRVNTDHKVIGMQYLATTIFFFIAGGLLAMLVRAELAKPGMQFFDNQTYNGLFSVHASLMIFLFVIPAFAGLANFVVPLMLGAPDMAFPRLNALSYWLLPIAGIMMLSSFIAPGGAFAAGWTGYAPLSIHQPMGTIFFNMGVQWAGASSIMTALNFLVTIITMRAPGMTFWRMPLLVWANFTTSLLVVIATPFIAGSQFFVMFDKVMHTHFFDVSQGGYPLGYQHIFWFYSHPAVYIMMLPGFGIASEVISALSRKPIFGYRLMALSLMAILVLGFSVWAHHMFVSGMAPWLRVPMMITTLMIAVPTGIKVFSWLATIWEGKLNFATPMLWAVGFVSMFVIGGLSGIYLGAVPIDIHIERHVLRGRAHPLRPLWRLALHDLRGHLLLVPEDDGPTVQRETREAAFLAHVHRLQPDVLPDAPDRDARHAAPRLGLLTAVRQLEPVHLDRVVRPRRVDDRVSLQHGHEHAPRRTCAEANPWRALTLEWQVSSPPPIFNFDEIPQVVGNPYEYGVPGARHAVLSGDTAATETEVRSPLMHLLVIANETVTGRKLIEAVEQRKGSSDLQVTVHRPGQPADTWLRGLRGHTPGGGREAPRPDPLDASRGGHLRPRARRGLRSRDGGARRARATRAPSRRGHPRNTPATEVGLATEERRRPCPRTRGRRPGRACRRGHDSGDGAKNVLVLANETVVGGRCSTESANEPRAATRAS